MSLENKKMCQMSPVSSVVDGWLKVCDELNWPEMNSSFEHVYFTGTVHSTRADWAPTGLVLLQPMKLWCMVSCTKIVDQLLGKHVFRTPVLELHFDSVQFMCSLLWTSLYGELAWWLQHRFLYESVGRSRKVIFPDWQQFDFLHCLAFVGLATLSALSM